MQQAPAAPEKPTIQPNSPEDDALKAELEEMVHTPMAIRSSKSRQWKEMGMCHHIGAAASCVGGLCLDICGFLDNMLQVAPSDVEHLWVFDGMKIVQF
eukprot:scaffold144973_cov49-Prasinocladus_malaysianus.AAC.1